MHVFLTGDRQVGKSTIVKKVIASLSCPIYGFETRFFPGQRAVLAMVPSGFDGPLRDADIVARKEEGRWHPLPDAFSRIGTALLSRPHGSSGVIIMDELGFLEQDAAVFQSAVLKTLSNDLPVLGVLRNGVAWHEAIRRHPFTKVITVTPENREHLPSQVLLALSMSFPSIDMMPESLISWSLLGQSMPSLYAAPADRQTLIRGHLLTQGYWQNGASLPVILENADGITVSGEGLSLLPCPLTPCKADTHVTLSALREDIFTLHRYSHAPGYHVCILRCEDEVFPGTDISRHNALSRVVGSSVGHTPVTLSVSSRVTGSLMEMAIRARIPVVVTEKAVSTEAVRLAQTFSVALVCMRESPEVFGAAWRLEK